MRQEGDEVRKAHVTTSTFVGVVSGATEGSQRAAHPGSDRVGAAVVWVVLGRRVWEAASPSDSRVVEHQTLIHIKGVPASRRNDRRR